MPEFVPPAHLWVPDRVGSYGDEAIDLTELAGRTLDQEQRVAVDAMLSYGPGGRWVALEAAVIEARQNGKTSGVILPVVLADLFLFDADRIVWTAHLFRTARDAFNDVCALIDGTSYLSRRVKKITYANGEESVELHTGARLEFLARSKGGGRGLGGKRLVMDEALFLSAESMGALIPTLSAREDPQIVYGSSAGLATSDHLRNLRNRGRKGGDPSLVWVEWCAPGGWENPPCERGRECTHIADAQPGCALDDESLWPLANPALGRRITYEFVRAERRALPAAEFGRERLGWFDEPIEDSNPFPVELWLKRVDTTPQRPEGPALAVAVTRDRSMSAIGTAGRLDEKSHVDVLAHRSGTGWVVDRAIELYDETGACALVLDPAGPAGALEKEFIERGFSTKPEAGERRLVIITARECAQACGALVDDVVNDRIRHRNRPELNAAAKGLRTRPLADAYAWSRKDSSVDITPMEVVTLARHGYATHGLNGTYDVLGSIW